MRPVHWLFVLRAASLLALGASFALLLDYMSAEMAFCEAGSGCGAVRSSGLGYVQFADGRLFPFMPFLGVLSFSLQFSLSLFPNPELRRRIGAPLAYANGVAGIALLALQALVVGRFCHLCIVVDISALAVSAAAFGLRRNGWDIGTVEEHSRVSLVDPSELLSDAVALRRNWSDDSRVYSPPNPIVKPVPSDPLRLHIAAWMLLLGISVAAPLAYSQIVAARPVPPVITALYVPGKVTVVEFFDFRCPHCRALSPVLHEVIKTSGPDIEFKRYPVPPLAPGPSRDASRLSMCAIEQGEGDRVMEALLDGPTLMDETVAEVAQSTKLDSQKLRECLISDRPDKQLAAARKRIETAGLVGFPTTYIGGTRLLGFQTAPALFEAIERARDGRDRGGLPPWGYWMLVLVVTISVAIWGRVRSKVVSAPDDLGSVRPRGS